MRNSLAAALAVAFIAGPAFAGALTLQIDDVKSVPEARAKNVAVAAHITACHSPEKTTVTATAEGIVNGRRQTIRLKTIRLSEPGSFAVVREWPSEGSWTVKMVATNPDYRNYATAIVAPIRNGVADPKSAKVFYSRPSEGEIASVLKQATLE